MLKLSALTVAVLMLAGCGPSSSITNYPMPPELSDCSQHKLTAAGSIRPIVVVRCPNSTTSTTHSESKNSTASIIVIDGVEYTPKR